MLRTLRITLAVLGLTVALGVATARAEATKAPATAAEHLAMSKAYLERAATWRAEAEGHRQMLADYRRTHPDRKSGARNRSTVEMERHCNPLISDARQRAAEAETLATFHRLRAMELEGQ